MNKIGAFLKKEFGSRVVKLPLDGGFTCPNRDGTKGIGGCLFCSSTGSGEFASNITESIKLFSDKWPDGSKYIAYFQSHTNTYAPVEQLESKFRATLSIKDPEIVGLAIATRPDCLTDEVYSLLERLNKETFMWVELGLQTIHDDTADFVNRCYKTDVYDEAVAALTSRGIRVVTHLILGLPKAAEGTGDAVSESREEMLASVEHVCKAPVFGIKLHMLNVVRGSTLAEICPNYVPFESIEQYVDLVVECVRKIPNNITIHRLNADTARPFLISPEWSMKKRTILNAIEKKLASMDAKQGDMVE
ncbi:MAG: TIGR01212 family radical SAM protein [Eubacteriales bacterium]|nr:TIGR01212 family radical SAM protein [Eubacteriales bacterium]MDD4389344.1 TIGR01212 family radical SAM protein [Eubacteriales bacterium]